METRSDNLKKVPVGSKTKKSNEEAKIRRKLVTANLERHAASVSRKKEIPQLTPLHRLQKFKVIRDRNLKSKGFKTSLDNKFKKMEEVTIATTKTVEIKEKVVVKETIEEIAVSNTNGIEKLDKNVKDLENNHDDNSSLPKEENHLSLRLKEESENKPTEKNELEDKVELKTTIPETSTETEPIQDSNIESNTETEEANKVYSASLSDNDAVSSVSSQQATNNSTPGATDDEEEVEVIESKPEYESNSKENKLGTAKEEREDNSDVSYRSSKESTVSFNKVLLNTSAASSYKSSYSNPSRIYGRRPVRCFPRSRKRKMEEDAVQNCDFKRTGSPSQLSPRWRFFPSTMNFWTPRTTPFAFSSTTPMKTLNDSMTVNIDEDTIRNDLEDSDLFSDADDFIQQPAMKKSRWGCAIM
ncbi:uncharacterized protein DDB_G0284459 [Halyomorpha halys]|uniref:uncharacterized protein DDB_G0284459 n=1 Tax=Halyomorpha halys TaxID=286706 RepID=UPI0006D4F774|nr:uncharacterized protein LOC106678305 [Halyomorpha halys]